MDTRSNSSNAQHESSPSNNWKPAVRRRRVTLSCRVCKMRKVRCDRQVPVCKRCAVGGWMNLCTYEEDNERSTRPQAPLSPSATTITTSHQHSMLGQGARLEQSSGSALGNDLMAVSQLGMGTDANMSFDPLDHRQQDFSFLPTADHLPTLAQSADPFQSMQPKSPNPAGLQLTATTNLPPDPSHTSSAHSPMSEADARLHDIGFETPFYGSTSSISCAAAFPHLAETLNIITSEYASSYDALGSAMLQLPKPTPPLTPLINVESLHSLLPPEFRCRQLMLLFFKHFNLTFRILHAPVFWRRYTEFWKRPKELSDTMPSILLAAMSCARCLQLDHPLTYDGDCSTASRDAIQWTTSAKQWSDQQGLKHTTLEFFQLRCLLMLSKKLNLMKMRSHYPESQTLMATAIAAGLHRSVAGLSPRPNFYDIEMRRRIWWAVTELELAESIERGLPSLAQNLFTDTEPPSNVADADMDDNSPSPPVVYPDHGFTESSFARHSQKIQCLRHRVSTLANNPNKHRSLSSSEINSLHEEIVGRLDAILSSGGFMSAQGDSGAALCRAMLEIYLHELLLLLHFPFAIGTSEQLNHHHSRFVCQGSARSTIELFAGLKDDGISQMSLPRTYLQRAILVLCRMDTLGSFRNPIYSQNCGPVTAVELTLKTFDMFEERILARGNGFRGLWLVFAASCFLKQHREGQAATLWREKTSARIISLASKISMSQVDPSQSEQRRDAVFALYMRHLQRTDVFASFGTADFHVAAVGPRFDYSIALEADSRLYQQGTSIEAQ